MVNAEKRRGRAPRHSAVSAEPSGSAVAAGTSATSPRGTKRPGLIARARYHFDLALARGPLVVIGYLGLIMLAIIFVAAGIDTVFSVAGVNGVKTNPGYAESFWQSLVRVLDSGTFASDQQWPTRILSLIVTLSGIFLAGSLIGLIATALDQQISNLRKGRSAVLEQNHTLVLGWSPRLPVIISELAIANENRKRPAVVVLADRPKDEMEDDLRRLVTKTGNTRIVCRTGEPGSRSRVR